MPGDRKAYQDAVRRFVHGLAVAILAAQEAGEATKRERMHFAWNEIGMQLVKAQRAAWQEMDDASIGKAD